MKNHKSLWQCEKGTFFLTVPVSRPQRYSIPYIDRPVEIHIIIEINIIVLFTTVWYVYINGIILFSAPISTAHSFFTIYKKTSEGKTFPYNVAQNTVSSIQISKILKYLPWSFLVSSSFSCSSRLILLS